jgi:hypothetical protein
VKEGASQTGSKPEMGVLRKLVSGRLQAQAAGPHPDPDVLAAFAENALLQAERAQLLQHLGACHNCREILYLAAPDSAEAQMVLSFQPKRRSWMMFRWGALAASVVIVGVAVTARHSLLQKSTLSSQSRDVATAPVSASPKMAQEKAPADVESARDRLAAAPQRVAKERPELKHMTAKPQASMQFDDSDQVRVSTGLSADQAKKSRNDDLTINGRSVAGLSAPSNQPPAAAPPTATGALAKDTSEVAGGVANLYALSAGKSGNLGGTINDLSGAAVANAKVTTVGPAGEKTATSDPEGRFVFSSLTPGTYSIKAEASGFKSGEIRQVAVLDNKTSTVGVKMEPGSSSEAIEVTGAAAALNEVAATAAPVATQEVVVEQKGRAQKQVAQLKAKNAIVANSLERAKASAAALPTPQWTLSSDGAVQRSIDLGNTWQKVPVGDGLVFRSLCAVGTQVWAGGKAGTLYHSVDSGQTWNQVQPAAANQKLTSDIVHIEFSDPANGLVSTSNGEVWSTSDGGQSWRRK